MTLNQDDLEFDDAEDLARRLSDDDDDDLPPEDLRAILARLCEIVHKLEVRK